MHRVSGTLWPREHEAHPPPRPAPKTPRLVRAVQPHGAEAGPPIQRAPADTTTHTWHVQPMHTQDRRSIDVQAREHRLMGAMSQEAHRSCPAAV